MMISREGEERREDWEGMGVMIVRREREDIFQKHSTDLLKDQWLGSYSPRRNELEEDISMGLISELQVKKI